MAGSPAVRARGISMFFDDIVALDDVDLEVGFGEVHGLVGPNGAGKTTLLSLILGLAVPDRGRLEILGERAGRGLRVPEGVAGFVDGPGLYPALTARQNLAALTALQGYGSAGIEDALAQVGLTEVAGERVRGFSLGMRQRLGLAAALVTRPRLLVLDEPANGLDPAGARHVHAVISELAAAGTAVVLSSHRMDELAALCPDVTILAAGRVAFSRPVDKLSAETGALDYRLRTSDPVAARRVATATPGLRVQGSSTVDPLVVRGPVCATDELVVRLVGQGVAVRELTPVIAPLEAALLALTTADADPGEGAVLS